MFAVCIFDLDGTLIDSARTSVAAIFECVDAFNFPSVSEDEIRRAIGIPNPDFYYHLYPSIPKNEVREFGSAVEKAEARLTDALGAEIAFSGVHDMLRALKNAGRTLYIASTGDEMHVFGALKATGLGAYFRDVYCAEADKASVVGRILSKHEGESAVMIGDTGIDAHAAESNGIPSVGAGYGYCSEDRRALFTEVAASVDELLKILLK